MRNALKVDLFPATSDFHYAQLERATVVPLGEAGIPCRVATTEDILLAKLRRYAGGGEVSGRQWSDIVGLLVFNPEMDNAYVEPWAARIGVTALLERARAAAKQD